MVAPNRLRTSRGYDEFELVLEGDARDRSQIRIKYRDGRKERWNPVEFVKLDAEQLPNYQGEYGCTDLESVYRISAIDGKLFIQLNYGRKRRLFPTVPDTLKP